MASQGPYDQEVAELGLKHHDALLLLRKLARDIMGNTAYHFDLQKPTISQSLSSYNT